jgi:hypothetical protein
MINETSEEIDKKRKSEVLTFDNDINVYQNNTTLQDNFKRFLQYRKVNLL